MGVPEKMNSSASAVRLSRNSSGDRPPMVIVFSRSPLHAAFNRLLKNCRGLICSTRYFASGISGT
jgi:hypothetical protein